jgi:HEPN domain-containing protein
MVHDPSNPDVWLKFARSDLAYANVERTSAMLVEKQLFHAQQGAEKSIKAVLIFVKIQPPKMHNIRELLDLLPPSTEIPDKVAAASSLTRYSTINRYPGLYENATENMRKEAVALAETVLHWATAIIASGR